MFRLMFALFAFLWSAMLDTEGGGSGGEGGGSEGGGSEGGGSEGGGESFTLTSTELTTRTNAAAAAKQKEIAELLGIDPDKIADAKGLIEAGRKAQQPPRDPDDKPRSVDDKPGEGDGIKDQVSAVLNDLLKPFTERLGQIEQTEHQRQQQADEQTRDEKLTAALKEANVRDDRLDAARTLALASGAKLNDKGELTGSKEAIEAAKKALPEAFRGDGDNGTAADANGRERTERKPKTLQEAVAAHFSKS